MGPPGASRAPPAPPAPPNAPPAPPAPPPPGLLPPGLPPEAAAAALDPHRNALMDKIRGAGGKRALKSVPRREKKESNFMAILKSEMKSETTKVVKKTVPPAKKSGPSS